jgi:hypothetical protein
MSRSVIRSAASPASPAQGQPLRVAFLGSVTWLDGCAPPEPARGLLPAHFSVGAPGEAGARTSAIEDFAPHVTVVLDPPSFPAEVLQALPGLKLGILVAGRPEDEHAEGLARLDRVLSFRPELTGTEIGGVVVWRAIPPPVSDHLFGEVRPLHEAPRAMSIGRSSRHREAILMPVKHHHDLLQVIHGLSGQPLAEVLGEYDVGVYVSSEPGGGFGQQVGIHLAAGHLLLAEPLHPAHGLERDIDYLQFDSPESLGWIFQRLNRFPEMHQRIRVRGRMKAEQYRASRMFARVLHDLVADVRAFGPGRRQVG